MIEGVECAGGVGLELEVRAALLVAHATVSSSVSGNQKSVTSTPSLERCDNSLMERIYETLEVMTAAWQRIGRMSLRPAAEFGCR